MIKKKNYNWNKKIGVHIETDGLIRNTPGQRTFCRSTFYVLIALLFLVIIPALTASAALSGNITIDIDAQPVVSTDLTKGYALTLHLSSLPDNNSLNMSLNNTASLDTSLDNADFSSIYELTVLKNNNYITDGKLEQNGTAEIAGYISYKYFGKLQFPISYDITDYGSYLFRLSKVSDGKIVSETSFNYFLSSNNINNTVDITTINNTTINVSNNVNNNVNNTFTNASNMDIIPVDIASNRTYANATQNNTASNVTLNILDKCSVVFANLDKEIYAVGESVKIQFSNIFGKNVNTELVITTAYTKYKFSGDFNDATFIPPEIGNYSIILTCDDAMILSKNFTVVQSNVYSGSASGNYTDNNDNNNQYNNDNNLSNISFDNNTYGPYGSSWKRIAIKNPGGKSVLRIVRMYNVTNKTRNDIKENHNGNNYTNINTNNYAGSIYPDNISLEVAESVDVNLSGIGSLSGANIKLNDLVFDPNQDLNISVGDIPRDKIIFNDHVTASFAMDLSGLNFTNGTFTKIASGRQLWKCVEWNFTGQYCGGAWIKIMDIIPGRQYDLPVSPVDPGYIETGVATINTLKSVYHVNETVDIAMVVLNTQGYLMPGVDVTLTIVAPDNATTMLSTNDGVNDNPSSITSDHRGIYKASFNNATVEGSYTMIVKAIGDDVNSTMISQFKVDNAPYFSILRNIPVTIDPGTYSSPKATPVSITFTTVLNVADFNYTEVLPAIFNVTDNGGATESIVGNAKLLTWHGLKNNSAINYVVQTPFDSPNVYEIGPGFIEYTYSSTSDVFYESRPWFLAIDPYFVGSFFMFWDGISSAPTGWTCVSCIPGDPFYQKFIMGDSMYGNTGGSDTHSHVVNYVNETAGTQYVGDNASGANGVNLSSDTHNHSGIVAANTSQASNYPLYRQLKVIAYNNPGSAPQAIPAGAIGIFNTTSLPVNWTLYSAENGYFILGNATANLTGGSNNHTHNFSITTTGSNGITVQRTGGTQYNVSNVTHTHNGSGTTSLGNSMPPYIDIVLARANVSLPIPYGQGFIGMFNTSAGDGWINLSQSGQPFYQKILHAAAAYNATGGGSNVSSHTNLVITTTTPSSNGTTRNGTGRNYSMPTHSHNITVSFSNATMLPPYIGVFFAYANNSVIYPPFINRTDCYKQGTGWVNCTTMGFNSILNAIRTNCYSVNPGGNVSNVSYVLRNIEHNITYFNVTITNMTAGYWTYNLSSIGNLTINQSGSYDMDINCVESLSSNTSINWNVPWGNLSVNLVSPSININVTQNKFFNFTVNLSCIGGECGNASVTLDPESTWWSSYWLYRREINITNTFTSPVSQNYSVKLVLNTTGNNFLANGNDVRIVLFNGTNWVEIDRVNETGFNSSATEIWFKLQSNISVGGYNDSYYVYYGNPAAGSPPANRSKVYLWFDDFNRLDTTDITINSSYTKIGGATWNITGNQLVVSNASSNITKLLVAALGSAVDDVDMEIQFNVTSVSGGNNSRLGLSQKMNATGGGYSAIIHNATSGRNLTLYNDVGIWGATVGFNITVNTSYYMKYQTINVTGNLTARSKVWLANDTEPLGWNVTGNYSTNNRPDGYVGVTGPNVGGNIVYYDNLQIRYIIPQEPNVTAGILEVKGKGDVPMNNGTPFYTINNNPVYPQNNSCLTNMLGGTNCALLWQLNATGNASTTWLFYVTTTPLIYSSYVNSTVSTIVNITIIGNVAPVVHSVDLTPYEATFSSNLTCTFNVTDQNFGDALSAMVNWYKNGFLTTADYVSAANGVYINDTLDSSYLTVGDVWKCGIVPFDQMVYGTEVFSQNVTIYSSIPPKINTIECLKNNQIWVPCSSIAYNQTIGKVRAKCNSTSSYPALVNFTFTNLDDSKTFFSGSTNDNSSSPGYFVFDNSDLLVLDSGTFNMSVSCTDVNGTIGYNSTSWFIPWGNLSVKLISPNVSMNVTSKQFFNFTSSVTCVGGECGGINATLDPYKTFFYSFENGSGNSTLPDSQGWTHYALNGTANHVFGIGNDYWHIENESSKFGNYCYKFGFAGSGVSYGPYPAGVLLSPVFSIRTNISNATSFSFYHYVDAEYVSGAAWDGGRMQYSIDNGIWMNITDAAPNMFIQGAYNYNYVINNAWIPDLWPQGADWTVTGLRIFGSRIASLNNFSKVVVDISSLKGETVQFRFYFGGDDNNGILAEGWFIDGFNITAWDYNNTKGVVSMNTSALPFYTTTQNPATPSSVGCLGNMHGGDTCNTTWYVNASDTSGTYTFYVIYNVINYSGIIADVNTTQVNLTIISNIPPNVTYISLDPEYALSTGNLNCTFTVVDASPLDVLGANLTWYRNGTVFSSTNYSVQNNVVNSIMLNSNLTPGETWSCSVKPFDQQSFGVQVNSTNKTVILGLPPSLNAIQCLRNNVTWTSCSNLVFGDTLSGVRINCTNALATITNATVNFTNIQDSKVFFNAITTTNITNWWIYYYNMTIIDSGDFIIQATCNNNNSVHDDGNVTWSIPWGRLIGSLVDPNTNTTVEYGQFFTFTANVTCVGGECGNVNALLDPGFPLGSPSNGTADSGVFVNPSSGDISRGSYINTTANDTTYYIIGKNGWGDTSSQIELEFNLTALSVDAHKNITSINITMSYCHTSKTDAVFSTTGCNGANPITRGWLGNQSVYLHNNNGSWDVIGFLNVTDGGNLVWNSYVINGSLSKYVNSTGWISARFDMNTGYPNDVNPATLGINYVGVTVTYEYIKGGAAIPTTIGALPFYTNNSNPFTQAQYSCLANMTSLGNGCQFTWNVNATGKSNTTHEFWVTYNSSAYPGFVNQNYSSHIFITIQNGSTVPPIVTLNYPSDNLSTSNSSVIFNCSATDNRNLISIALYGDFAGTFGENETVYVSGKSNTTTYNRVLSEGRYIWNCMATDNDYNARFANNNRTLLIDSTPPYINLSSPINGENVSSPNVTFNFTVIDNLDNIMKCNITVDSVVKDSGFTAYNNTKVSRPIGGFTQGDHYWNVTCADRAGNVNVSETRLFTISNTPPVVVLQTIDNYMTNSPNVDLYYYADDNKKVSQADLYINGLWNNTDSGVITGATNGFSLTGLVEGKYNWTVNVTDDGGLTAQAATRRFIVDLTNPTLNVTFPQTGYSTNSTTVTFIFNTTDNFDSIMACKITINGIDVATGINANAGQSTSKPVSNIKNGLNYWNITCVDDAGNFNTSDTRILNISAPPIVALNNPADNTSQKSVNITLYYTPTSYNNNITNCSLYINGIYNQTNTTVNNGVQNTFKLYNLIDNLYYWNVTCFDSTASGSSTTRKFYIDNSPPNISLNFPTQWGTVYGGVTTFNFTAYDNFDSILICNLTIDGALNKTAIQAPNGQWVNFTVAITAEGNHTWSIGCRDSAGNSNNSITQNFTTINAPTVNLVVPAQNAYLNYTNNINFTFIPGSSGTLINATLYINGVVNQTMPNPANGLANSFFLNFSSNGVYNWSVKILDSVGLTGSSVNRTFSIDTVAPIINIMIPTNGQIIGVNNVSFKFNVTENLPAAVNCNITVNGTLQWTNVSASTGSAVARYMVLNDGNYSWSVTCIDNSGNINSSNLINFTVFAPPNVTLNFPTPNYRTRLQNITFNYTPLDDIGIDNCTLVINGIDNQNSTSIAKNIPNYFNVTGVTEGDYNWTVRCTDAAPTSNVYAPPAINFTIDLTPPAISMIYPNSSAIINTNIVHFNWTATDYPVNIACMLFVDGIYNLTLTQLSGTYFTPTVTNLASGLHNWSLNCSDDIGNSILSPTRNFTINNADLYLDSSRIYFNNTNPNENQTILISANVTNIGGIPAFNVLVNFFDGDPGAGGVFVGNFTGNVSVSGSTLFSVPWNITTGYHTIYVLTDPYNAILELNESNNNATKTISLLLASITNPYNNSGFVNPNVSVTFNLQDFTGGQINYSVFVDNVLNGQNGTITDNTPTVINVTLPQGKHAIKIGATDLLGRMKNSTAVYITVDYTAPNGSIISPTWFNYTKPLINITATDNVDTNINYTIYLNGSIDSSGNITNGSNIQINLSAATEGSYKVIMGVTDDFNNSANSTPKIIYIDLTPPSITLNSPIDGANYSTRTVVLNYTANDNMAYNASCNLTLDGNIVSSNVISIGNVTTYTANNLAEGKHYWNVTCQDQALNTNVSITRSFNVYMSPSITLISPPNNNWSANSNNTFLFNISDETGFTNCSIIINGLINQTKSTTQLVNNAINNFTLNGMLSGQYNWSIECYDNTSYHAYNVTSNRTLYVDLLNPDPYIETANNSWFNTGTPLIKFNISDNMDALIDYTFYVNGTPNVVGTISNGGSTSVSLVNLQNGSYTVILQGVDNAGNSKNSTPITIYVDTVKPSINLTNPQNSTNVSVNTLNLNFTPSDNMASVLVCNLTLDGSIIASNMYVNNSQNQNVTVSALLGGYHYWNVTCIDNASNINTSSTYVFYVIMPDLYVNTSFIYFSDNKPIENETVNITATIFNLGPSVAQNFTVEMRVNSMTGTLIYNGTMSLGINGIANITTNYTMPLGDTVFYVLVDTPLSTNGTIVESNESNNNASATLHVGLWEYIYGSTNDRLVMTDSSNQTIFDWLVSNASGSKLFAADIDSTIHWRTLQALGRNTSNQSSPQDFYTLDTKLGSVNFTDSVNRTYTNSGSPIETTNYTIYTKNVNYVPIVNSTNNTNFKTGILWDYNIGTTYNGTQDILFVSPINKNAQGYNATVDYEIRVPASLRSYKSGQDVVVFYAEIN